MVCRINYSSIEWLKVPHGIDERRIVNGRETSPGDTQADKYATILSRREQALNAMDRMQ